MPRIEPFADEKRKLSMWNRPEKRKQVNYRTIKLVLKHGSIHKPELETQMRALGISKDPDGAIRGLGCKEGTNFGGIFLNQEHIISIRPELLDYIVENSLFDYEKTHTTFLKDNYRNNFFQCETDIAETRERNITTTKKEQMIQARLGQGLFRQRVIAIDKKCIVTGVACIDVLIASHIKPWRVCSDEERLDGNNGLLLSPHIDILFDSLFISFSDNAEVLVYDDRVNDILEKWNIKTNIQYASFSDKRKEYLSYHRAECEKERTER